MGAVGVGSGAGGRASGGDTTTGGAAAGGGGRLASRRGSGAAAGIGSGAAARGGGSADRGAGASVSRFAAAAGCGAGFTGAVCVLVAETSGDAGLAAVLADEVPGAAGFIVSGNIAKIAAATNGASRKSSAVRMITVSDVLAPRVERQNRMPSKRAMSPISALATAVGSSGSISLSHSAGSRAAHGRKSHFGQQSGLAAGAPISAGGSFPVVEMWGTGLD